MEVILLEKIEKLGNIGEQVNVKSGYGRNYLLPQGMATAATVENIAIFEARRAELEAKQAEEVSSAQARAEKLEGLELSITAKSGVEGKLFGSLGTIDIAEAATNAGVEIERSEVRLPDGPLRAVGEYDIEIHLHANLNVAIKVNVIGDHDVDPLAEEEADNDDEAETEVSEE